MCFRREMTYLLLADPTGGPVFSGLLYPRQSHLVFHPLPNLGDLLHAVGPNGIFGLQLRPVLIRVKDHGDGGLVAQFLLCFPFHHVLLSLDSGSGLAGGLLRLGTRSLLRINNSAHGWRRSRVRRLISHRSGLTPCP